jgi:4-amino-4-deoxy-L-arabinose transferase-like glycosyltransferase
MTEQTRPGLKSLLRLIPGFARVGAMTPGLALAFVIAASILFHLAWGAALEASNDEAYHFLYTTHLDLSYFDHPPMTAWVAKAGLLLCGNWVHPLSLRLGFVLMFAASSWVLARWTARWFGPWAGVYAAILLNVSGYYAAAGGFALPDVPYLFFALLTMWALSEALVAEPGKFAPWGWVGLAFGAALLSKYHAVFLPASAGLYILVTPGARRILLTPGPYLAIAVGFALFAPVLAWNAAHGWASFRFQGGRAVGGGFQPEGLVASVLGPVLYLLPWVWYVLVAALVWRLRHFRSVAGTERLIVCLAVVPLTFFVAVSCFRWTLLHWPLVGFIALYPLAGAKWAELALAYPRWSRRCVGFMVAAILVGAAVGYAQARHGVIHFGEGKDPLADVSGWESVADEVQACGFTAKPKTFFFTTKWFESGQLAFALRDRVPVLCYNPGDARGFAFWSKPEQWVGWTGYLVTTEDDEWEAEMVRPYFTRVRKVAEFPMTRGGVPFRTVRVWRCVNQKFPFPFTYPEG